VFLCQVIWFIIIYTSDIMKTFERIDKDKDKNIVLRDCTMQYFE